MTQNPQLPVFLDKNIKVFFKIFPDGGGEMSGLPPPLPTCFIVDIGKKLKRLIKYANFVFSFCRYYIVVI